MTPPRATLRLQFHKDFTFADAARHVDYFDAIGVSHIYASPILKARAGSMHGYDVIDHSLVNEELGGEDGLRMLVVRLRERNLGLIADIVPNHMCVSDPGSIWWNDVLEWGQESRYAGFFDIDWQARDPALRGKVHVPFLAEPYGEALAKGQITLDFDREMDRFFVRHFDRIFPVTPLSRAIMEEAGGGDPAAALSAFDPKETSGLRNLHRLLEAQNYRLAWWRTAADEINWRRFFDISDLAGLRIEKPAAFEATHALMLRLYAEGLVDGFRIDHIDGLADPRTYCRRLRRCTDDLARRRPPAAPRDRAWILVEKILAAGEQLPMDWRVDGTTGYDFMDQVSGLLHNPHGEAPLTEFWNETTGNRRDFGTIAKTTRRLILDENLHSERDKVTNLLHGLARLRPETRDYRVPMLRRALTELLVHFPVYRSYATPAGRSEEDAKLLAKAIGEARGELLDADGHMLDLIDGWLGGIVETGRSARSMQRRAIVGFQQLTSALTAKAVEDTAFYRYGRLLSRNEVGSSPADFSYERDRFHAACAERLEKFPSAMLATATHDHKRGEDARMRLATLSEIPGRWTDAVRRWTQLNAPFRASLPSGIAPEPRDEIMLYQTLLSAWPMPGHFEGTEWLTPFTDRILGWLMKSIREAKRRSRWIAPDDAYEEAAASFAKQILDPEKSSAFISDMNEFVAGMASAAAINALSQTLLRMTVPGVPDLYQGTEFWDLSLVDPDNRRPVDFAARTAALAGDSPPADLLRTWTDGRIKQSIIARTLATRAARAGLFAEGKYQPLTLQGEAAVHAVAFMRVGADGDTALVLASRFPAALLDDEKMPLVPPDRWKETGVVLPASGGGYTDALTGQRHLPAAGTLLLRDIFSRLPVAILLKDKGNAA